MEEDRKISLTTAVAMAGWTHNTNMNHSGFSPLQLVTGKSITIPGLTFSTPPTLSHYDADIVKNIITNHITMMKDYTSAEFTKKLFEVSEMRRSAYQDIKYSPGDKVYYQDRKDKAWYGPVKVISHDSNVVFILDRNTLKKLNQKCCMPYDERKMELAQSLEEKSSTQSPFLKEEIPDTSMTASENQEDEEDDEDNSISTRTRSKHVNFEDNNADLKNDIVGAYYISLPNKEELTEISIYGVEIPTKHHGRLDVIEAKKMEMKNLRFYDTWTEVPYTGQALVGTKWVITESEKQDGQKQAVKGRLCCKGYEETLKPQSDSPTISRSNILVFTAVAANQNFHLWAIDIKGAYLQSNVLDRDIFIRPPLTSRKKSVQTSSGN